MKKTIITVLLALILGIFSAEQSKALVIDLGYSTIGQVTQILPVTAEDLEGDDVYSNLYLKMVPWVIGTLTNDSDQTVTFSMASMSYYSGDIISGFNLDFPFYMIELDPGEVFSAPIIKVVAAYHALIDDNFVLAQAPIGMIDGINQIDFQFTVDGVEDSISYAASPGQFLWGVEVVSPENNPVPEPTTMLLFGTGLAGLVGVTLRKKKA